MNTRIVFCCVAVAIPSLAAAQNSDSYRCTSGDLVRRVEIAYENGGGVPCEVHYYRDTEAPGERQVLWRADNETGFCESRAQEFVAQLRSWGWNCVGAAAGAAAGVPDDTDALSAGDEP